MVYTLNRALNPAVKSQYAFFLSPIRVPTKSPGQGEASSRVSRRSIPADSDHAQAAAPYFPALASMWPYWVVDQASVDRLGKTSLRTAECQRNRRISTRPPGCRQLIHLRSESSLFRDQAEGQPSRGNDRSRCVCTAGSLSRGRVRCDSEPRCCHVPPGAARLRASSAAQTKPHPSHRLDQHVQRQGAVRQSTRAAGVQSSDRQACSRPRRAPRPGLSGAHLPAARHAGKCRGDASAHSLHRQAARQLLSQAGLPDGEGFPNVTMNFSARSDFQAVAEFVQSELQEEPERRHHAAASPGDRLQQ